MNKYLKIGLFALLVVILAVVVFLMFGGSKQVDVDSDLDTEILESQNEEVVLTDSEVVNENDTSFEDDVMKDLEGFFNSNNGYEDVEGEFGFIDAEAE